MWKSIANISLNSGTDSYHCAISTTICFRKFLHYHHHELNSDGRIPHPKRAQLGKFVQSKPKLINPYEDDSFARTLLQVYLPNEIFQSHVEPDLKRFGQRIVQEIDPLGLECERDQPRLVSVDAWAEPINKLYVSRAWKQQKRIAAEEQLIRIGYERPFGEWSRLYQMMKIYMHAPSSGYFSCPLAMTDGAAKTLESIGLDTNVQKEAFQHLISDNPDQFWTSGQWMTEKRGGSDVANGTETIAIPVQDDVHLLYGYKFFTSSSDADMALTLARVTDSKGQIIRTGGQGLALFLVICRRPNDQLLKSLKLEHEFDQCNELNGIHLIRLKDKLGTRQMPTTELLLDSCLAYRLGSIGNGIKDISHMLQITRLYNAFGSIAAIRRTLSLAKDYSTKRIAFGKRISDHPLHLRTLANMEVEARAGLSLCFQIALLLGKQDTKVINTEEQLLLRLLVPLGKLYTAKQAVAQVSEGLECFGGQGYMEDTNIGRILRDTQVLPIWEGTTNILSLDVLRVLLKQPEAYQVLAKQVHKSLECEIAQHESIQKYCQQTLTLLNDLTQILMNKPEQLELGARDFAFTLSNLAILSNLLNVANQTKSDQELALVRKFWQTRVLCPFVIASHQGRYDLSSSVAEERNLVFFT